MTPPFILQVLLLGSLLSTFPIRLFAQNLVERLGYPPGTRLIIVHADDLGETHSVNAAAIKALQGGTINSASTDGALPMVSRDCRLCQIPSGRRLWSAPHIDERTSLLPLATVAPADKVPSLVDQNGYFHHDWRDMCENFN
jgi:chitin disaccharide deacetylase